MQKMKMNKQQFSTANIKAKSKINKALFGEQAVYRMLTLLLAQSKQFTEC